MEEAHSLMLVKCTCIIPSIENFKERYGQKKIKNLQEPYKKPPILNPSMHIHSTPESQTKFYDVVCSLGKISK